jgi:hypothetical protein
VPRHSSAVVAAYGSIADIDTRPQSSRLAEFGGLGMSFNICRGTFGSLAMLAAIRRALVVHAASPQCVGRLRPRNKHRRTALRRVCH